MKQTAKELYAQLYDVRVPDWQGAVNFYRELVANVNSKYIDVLEIACGTGRIAIRLAQDGATITGLDLSPELLEIARGKSIGVSNISWVQGDMRTFEIDKKFGLVIIPGHSFQFMLTPDDQVKCLENIKRHLLADGTLVVHLDHQDVSWLGELVTKKEPAFETGRELIHPITGQKIRTFYLWTFEPSTQTAAVTLRWEETSADGSVIERWEMNPMPLHCVFRFEMEHLLKRVGFSIEAVYGDFFKSALTKESGQMIWVVRNKAG
ncbi:MAG: class I SAM-dependent methyltransferase [Chloroflexi bacterium]|nr:class I SAM-dependent methyltransferase [Chloroflexota bacterium]